jgi:hypothetical protein
MIKNDCCLIKLNQTKTKELKVSKTATKEEKLLSQKPF